MRALLVLFALAVGGLSPGADPPAKKVELPNALLEFSARPHPGQVDDDIRDDHRQRKDANYELTINFGDRGNTHTRNLCKDDACGQLGYRAIWRRFRSHLWHSSEGW